MPDLPEGVERWTLWVREADGAYHLPSGHLGVGREATPTERADLRSKGFEPRLVVAHSDLPAILAAERLRFADEAAKRFQYLAEHSSAPAAWQAAIQELNLMAEEGERE